MNLDCKIRSVLDTDLLQIEVAELFRSVGWEVRKWSWTGYEIRCDWAQLYLDGEGEILMHGPITDPLTHSQELFATLEQAGIKYWGEFYGADSELLQEFNG